MIGSILLLVILLSCSAFLSGSETVLFSLSRYQLHQCQRSSNRLRRLVAELMRLPRRVLLTILIGNTTVNVLIFATSYVLSHNLSQENPLLASLWGVVTVILVIVIGEVLAKTFALSVAFTIAPWVAAVIKLLQLTLAPVRIVLDSLLVAPINRLLVGAAESKTEQVTVDDLQKLVALSNSRDIIASHEKDMLQEVVALAEIKVRSIMVPRVDMVVFKLDDRRDQLLQLIRRRGFTKIPVVAGDVDHLEGSIHARDLYLHPDTPLAELIRPVNFVPEQMTADKLLKHFRESGSQLAIVVDEYGGVAGLVTLEDVVEQIVGEISERGEQTQSFEQIGPSAFRVAGDFSLDAFHEPLSIGPHDARITTMGGLVAARLGRLPHEGDELQVGNVHLTVELMSGKRVRWIRVELPGGE